MKPDSLLNIAGGLAPGDVRRTNPLNSVIETLLVWQERAHQRRHMASLDTRILKDVGLTRGDIDAEIAKPFWRP